MKITRAGAALAMTGAAVAAPAMAQGQVTVYGIVDTGVVYTNANAAGGAEVKVPGLTGSLPSRVGLRGVEELGAGLQALFVLEAGISPDTGTSGQGNRLFGREAYVGLQTPYGTLTLGRQHNMTYLAAQDADVLGPNLFSMSSIDPYIPNARSDNALGYMGNFGNFTVGATYSVGRDASNAGGPAATNCPGEVAGDAKACRQITALIGYEHQAFGLSASYDKMHGNTGAAAGLGTSKSTDRRTTFNAYAMVGATKIGAGVLLRKKAAATSADNLDTRLYYIGASFPVSPALVLDGEVAHLDNRKSDDNSTLTVLRLTYSLSKRTAAYASVGYMKNDGMAANPLDVGGSVGAGENQSGIFVGLRHIF